ncbi:cation transporter [Aspergillus taichungensis]|uniref:Cation transporter n=1 Tax=Aspergillus taichungensis TaxID=482145 RepID=A0A2J5HDN4_9EURO|nr:cation transporter [Aspergillus taichungensis]
MLEPPADKSPLRIHHHYIYICAWAFVGSIILYLPGRLTYVDALLLATGAATQSGLTPLALDRLHIVQQVTLWFVTMVTNIIFVHSLLVLIRLYWFRKRFRNAIRDAKSVCHNQRRRQDEHLAEVQTATPSSSGWGPSRYSCESPLTGRPSTDGEEGRVSSPHISFDRGLRPLRPPRRRRSYSSSFSRTTTDYGTEGLGERDGTTMSLLPSLAWQQSIASYSDWDETQKEELGGIEYRALKTLMVILICYFVALHALGAVVCVTWVSLDARHGQLLEHMGIGRSWWAVFTAGSAFNDLGFTLTSDSMESFRTAPLPLLVMTFLIVAGNTGFPCFLRLIIWVLSQVTGYGTPLDEELQFLLEHPRRCFTLLFPRVETWRLVAILLALNAFDLFVYYTLQTTPQEITPVTSGMRLINGLFQIASTRTAGFSITSLRFLHPAVQVSFVIMMYISAFPIAISMRKTNIYEEKSLGIYEDDEDNIDWVTGHPVAPPNSWTAHIQHQLGFDLWYVMLGFFLIALAEGAHMQQRHGPDAAFSLFPVLFEIVSAYGTVGLSLGYPRSETSLCGRFSAAGKLVIIAMQLRGRHRGLPHAIDHAILLPCDVQPMSGDGEWWWKSHVKISIKSTSK